MAFLAVAIAVLSLTAPASVAAVDMTSSGPTIRQASVAERALYQAQVAVPMKPPREDQPDVPDWYNSCDVQLVDEQGSNDKLLAINRWGDAAGSIHTRLDADPWNDVMNKVQRSTIDSSALGIGNSMWGFSTSLVNASNRFCAGDAIAAKMDNAAGKFAKSIWGDQTNGSILIVALFIGCLGLAVFRKMRTGTMNWKPITKFAITAGIFLTMMNAALGSVANPGSDSAVLKQFSPGWFQSKVSTVIASTTGAIGAQISSDALTNQLGPPLAQKDATTNKTSCLNYIKAMHNAYVKKYQRGGSLGSAAAVPLIMDNMWLLSGYGNYVNVQYGKDNVYGWNASCRVLDSKANIPLDDDYKRDSEPESGTQWAINKLALGTDPNSDNSMSKSIMFNPDASSDSYNNGEDMLGFAWAMCRFDGKTWSVNKGWEKSSNPNSEMKKLSDDGANGAKICEDLYRGTPGKRYEDTKDAKDTPVNWQDGADKISTGMQTEPENRGTGHYPVDFGNSWHGVSSPGASTTGIIYALVAFASLAVFGGLAFVVLCLKIMLMAVAVLFFLAALVDLIPGRETSLLAKSGKLVLGFAVIAWGYSAVLALLAAITGFIVAAGQAIALPDIGRTAWNGVAPLAAVIILKLVWSKLVKAPDPLSVRGASAYGRGALTGGIGGAAAGAIGGYAAGARDRLMHGKATPHGRSPVPAGASASGSAAALSQMHEGDAGRVGGFSAVPGGTNERELVGAGVGSTAAGAAGLNGGRSNGSRSTGIGGRALRGKNLGSGDLAVAGLGGSLSEKDQRRMGQATARQAKQDALAGAAARRLKSRGDGSPADLAGLSRRKTRRLGARQLQQERLDAIRGHFDGAAPGGHGLAAVQHWGRKQAALNSVRKERWSPKVKGAAKVGAVGGAAALASTGFLLPAAGLGLVAASRKVSPEARRRLAAGKAWDNQDAMRFHNASWVDQRDAAIGESSEDPRALPAGTGTSHDTGDETGVATLGAGHQDPSAPTDDAAGPPVDMNAVEQSVEDAPSLDAPDATPAPAGGAGAPDGTFGTSPTPGDSRWSRTGSGLFVPAGAGTGRDAGAREPSTSDSYLTEPERTTGVTPTPVQPSDPATDSAEDRVVHSDGPHPEPAPVTVQGHAEHAHKADTVPAPQADEHTSTPSRPSTPTPQPPAAGDHDQVEPLARPRSPFGDRRPNGPPATPRTFPGDRTAQKE